MILDDFLFLPSALLYDGNEILIGCIGWHSCRVAVTNEPEKDYENAPVYVPPFSSTIDIILVVFWPCLCDGENYHDKFDL